MQIYTLMGQAYVMKYNEAQSWAYLFSRDESGDPHTHIIKKHRPHFSIQLSKEEGEKWDHEDEKLSIYADIATGQRSYYLQIDEKQNWNDWCYPDNYKIHGAYIDPGATPKYRKALEDEGYTHYEANIEYPYRVLIDYDIYDKYYIDEANNNKLTPIKRWLLPGEKPADQKLYDRAQTLVIRPRCCVFDIETDNKDGLEFPSWKDPKFKIQSIQFIDTYKPDTVLNYWVQSSGNIPLITEITKEGFTFKVETIIFATEKEMIRAFVAYAKRVRFDHYYAHNGNEFDLPYLYKRSEKLRVDLSGLSPLNRVYIREELLSEGFKAGDQGKAGQTTSAQPVVISGCSCMDTIPVIKKYTYQKKEVAYSQKHLILKNYGGEFYEGLEDYGRKAGWALQNDPEGLWRYSNLDVIGLFLLITQIYPIIIQYDNYRRIAGVAAHDSLSNSKFLKILKIRIRRMLGYPPMRTKSTWKKGDQRVPGAYVKPPRPGLSDWVAGMDYASMYPTIIEAENMGSETLIPKQFAIDMGIPYIESYDGVCFRTDIISVNSYMAQIVKFYRKEAKDLKKYWGAQGDEVKKKTYDDIQLAFKLLGVSIYGDAVYPFSPDYNYDVGRAITGRGREWVTGLDDFYATTHSLVTIAGDTDSTFVELSKEVFSSGSDIAIPELYQYVLKLEDSANQWLKGRARELNHTIQMSVEAEKIISRIVFKEKTLTQKKERQLKALYQSLRNAEGYGWDEEIPGIQEKIEEIETEKGTKKQYIYRAVAVKDEKGNFVPVDQIVQMGMAGKRTDTPTIIRSVFDKIGDMLMRDTIQRTKSYIYTEFKKIESYSLDEIAITKGFNKHPKYYVNEDYRTIGAAYAEKYFHQALDRAIKPKYICIKPITHKKTDVYPPETVCYDKVIRPLKVVCTLTESFNDIPEDFWEFYQIDWTEHRNKIFSPIKLLIDGIGENWDMLSKGQNPLTTWLS